MSLHLDSEGEPIKGSPAEPTTETEQVVESGAGIERRERSIIDGAGLEHRERIVHDIVGEQRQQVLLSMQLISLCVGTLEALIAARVVLKVLAANPENAFAQFVYNTSSVFLAPFFGLTGSPAAGGSVLEVPSLVAMAVYAILGWGVMRLVSLLFSRTATRSTATYDRRWDEADNRQTAAECVRVDVSNADGGEA